jgi:putative Ca2+/H+ antiporter (TMEM165/GDT1 family)
MWRTFLKNISLNTLKDLYHTFSNEKSFLSSKKIERSLFVTTILAMYWTYFIMVVLKASITDFILFISPLFIAAGFNLLQSEKNKKNEKTNPGPTDSNND